ncbi:helix-turn-helix domain-containing protein [Brevibacillus dissolubilis]|uniref:helix-turn-helix domain-containing protein n=1 Tax=Brevibacillus dissolubilis TaxID=1844116 RepID=UPI001116AAFC|nr:helix-turn-helix transcriptional regulator [Brevibacillus dissolubilis]
MSIPGDFASRVLDNINSFLEAEGYRKERLAKKMGKSPSTFYAHLKGQHPKSIVSFAVELAQVLGYKDTFFLDENFTPPILPTPSVGLHKPIHFSKGNKPSLDEEKGLEQLAKICDLIEIYY